jgi:hypothetical protein
LQFKTRRETTDGKHREKEANRKERKGKQEAKKEGKHTFKLLGDILKRSLGHIPMADGC